MKKFIITLLVLTLGLTGVASGKKKDEPPFNFSKNGTYYIGAVNIKLTGTKKTKDKEETFNSREVLAAELRSALAKYLQEKGKLAQDAASAQASLEINVTYGRNCVALSSQRMPPILQYNMKATKDGSDLGSYYSEKLISKGNPYSRVSNAKELVYIQSLAQMIGETILNSEQ